MIGYLLLTHIPDKWRLRFACGLFDGSIYGCIATMFYTHEPKWILALSWGALTLTAWDMISTALVLTRQKGGGKK